MVIGLNVGDGLLARKESVATERAAIDDEIWGDVLHHFESFVIISGVGCFLHLGEGAGDPREESLERAWLLLI